MVRERAEKVARVADCIPALEVDGPKSGRLLVVGWGGTYGHLGSAVAQVRSGGLEVGYAHFDYINPLPGNTADVLARYDRILVCELNSGHFAGYLRSVLPQFRYMQYNKVEGQPFLVQELVSAITAAWDGPQEG